jgi:membrane associated rhomboid family serine protease
MQRPAAAINPLPPAVIGLAAVIFGVELMFSLAQSGFLGGTSGLGWRTGAVQDYGFFATGLDWMLQNHSYPPDLLMRFVTYPLLHLSFTHALFVAVFILAIGKLVGEAFGNLAVLSLFFGTSIFAALVFGLIGADDYPLVGGYPGVYGLIGAYTFLLWTRAGLMGQSQLMAFRLIAVLLGIQLVFGLIAGSSHAWLPDLAGFVGGFAGSFLLVPGGWRQLRDRIRNR